jgi:hypothetical protein
LLENRWCHGQCLARRKEEVPGITRSYLHHVSVLAQAQDVLAENDLYALRHGLIRVLSTAKRPAVDLTFLA